MNEEVEVYPAGFGAKPAMGTNHSEQKRAQKTKWLVLTVTFLLIVVPLLLYVWSRPSVYQSRSIIHFSYPVQLGQEMADVPIEQVTLNQQRLTSYRILEAVSQGFLNENYVEFSPEQLSQMLSAEADTASRTINLYATGNEPLQLKPLLDNWLKLYTAELATEKSDDNLQQLLVIDDKLQALEEKIRLQREVVEAFARDNQIVSGEREENRTLNKVQGLSRSLDEAQAQQAETKARLSSIEQAVQAGQTVIHPSDTSSVEGIETEIATLEAELKALAEIYTPVYMQRDTNIVAKQRNLEELKGSLERTRANSQARYLQDTRLAVATADENVSRLQQQFDQLNTQAQQFNEQLTTYNRHLESLSQLEVQSQQLTDQRTQLEVQKPYEAVIRILEQPFVPSFPIGPENARDTVFVLLAGTGGAILVLMLYSFIVRRGQNNQVTNYTLVAGDPKLVNPQFGLTHSSPQELGHQQPVQSLTHQSAVTHRLLSEQELQALYDAANEQAKLFLSLLLHGVSANELVTLTNAMFSAQQLTLPGVHSRSISLQGPLLQDAAKLAESSEPDDSFWHHAISLADVDAALVNSAHDAALSLPEQITLSAVRHTYLTFIVCQGVKLNDLQLVAGYTEPSALTDYRNVNRQQDLIEVEQAKTDYPLSW